MKKFTLLAIAILLGLFASAQTQKDVNIKFMLRGHIYAQSSFIDTTALGGFALSSNSPKKITGSQNFNENKIILKIDTSKIVPFAEEFNGYDFFIANNTSTVLKLDASDSRLSAIAEAYVDNRWQPIEYLPSSWCGNSYHEVYLNPGEYWQFQIPKFDGKIDTKIRYRLTVGKDEYIYSNEIAAKINKQQLSDKKNYNPNGIMDPYND
jgi:hypothetical protein